MQFWKIWMKSELIWNCNCNWIECKIRCGKLLARWRGVFLHEEGLRIRAGILGCWRKNQPRKNFRSRCISWRSYEKKIKTRKVSSEEKEMAENTISFNMLKIRIINFFNGTTVMFCFFIVINASKNKISRQERVLSRINPRVAFECWLFLL